MSAPGSLPLLPEVLETIKELRIVPTATCRIKGILSEKDPVDLGRDVLQLLGVLRPAQVQRHRARFVPRDLVTTHRLGDLLEQPS